MKVDALDHLVLTVACIEATCRFYTRVLGMEVAPFGDGRRALHFGRQKINLHQSGNEFEPKAQRPTTGSADLCLLTGETPGEIVRHLQAQNVPVVEGPVPRTGAQGPMTSFYVGDPDGNLIEIATYVPSQRA